MAMDDRSTPFVGCDSIPYPHKRHAEQTASRSRKQSFVCCDRFRKSSRLIDRIKGVVEELNTGALPSQSI